MIEPICSICKASIPVNEGESCLQCGEPIDGDLPDSANHICGSCRLNPPYFDETIFSLLYEEKTRELIHHFKFRNKPSIYIIFSRLISAVLHRKENIGEYDFLIPVPLYVTRLLKRGYNQSYLLAKGVAENFNIPLRADLVQRVRETKPQIELKRNERAKNIKGAFKVTSTDMVNGKNIILVDDIMTTGATLNEISRILKKSGAKRIASLVVARA